MANAFDACCEDERSAAEMARDARGAVNMTPAKVPTAILVFDRDQIVSESFSFLSKCTDAPAERMEFVSNLLASISEQFDSSASTDESHEQHERAAPVLALSDTRHPTQATGPSAG